MKKRKTGFAVTGSAIAADMARRAAAVCKEKGTRRQWTPEEAKEAGRKGGKANAAVPGRMAELGRKGGMSRGAS